MNKKIKIYAGIVLFISSGFAATHIPPEEPGWKNLKVIPKSTDDEQMERLMHQYTKQLGVTCSYCHPDTKPGILPVTVDFAIDELPEKGIARKMMIMTDKINKKYFKFKNRYDFENLNNRSIVTCNTCHRGLPKPNNMQLFNTE